MSEDEIREIVRCEIARFDSQRRSRWTVFMRSFRQAVLMLLAAIEGWRFTPKCAIIDLPFLAVPCVAAVDVTSIGGFDFWAMGRTG